MAVSETIVREYFERHGFLVRQGRKYVAPHAAEEEEADFFVLNPHPVADADRPLPFQLAGADLARVGAAVVVVRGWHTETFSPSRIAGTPELFRFVEPAVFQQAVRSFGVEQTPLKILVVPALPQDGELREQSFDLLRGRGLDAVIPFRTILADLIDHVEPNRNYQKSDLLQTLRVLKNYGFLREPQLELFRAGPRRRPGGARRAKPAAGSPGA